MNERPCPKCGSAAATERSGIRRTLRCYSCGFVEIKNVIQKGVGGG